MRTTRKKTGRKKPGLGGKWILFKKIVLIGIYAGVLGSIGVFSYLYYLSQDLPSLDQMTNPV
mgnify:CR=1 FL=1